MLKNKYTKICPKCKVNFLVFPSGLKRKYCSRKCQNQCIRIGIRHSIKTKQKIGKANKGETYSVKCPTCLKSFEVPVYKNTKYCSGNCYWQSHTRTGENGANWRGGTTSINRSVRTSIPYQNWRTSVFERDNYTCVICGVRNGNGKKINLEADHIETFASLLRKHNIDSVQSALICADLWSMANGRTLCVDCHRKTDNFGAKAKNYSLIKNF